MKQLRNKLNFGARCLAAALGLGAAAAGAQTVSNALPDLVVDDFDEGLTHGVYTGRKTTIGAYQGTWARRPSYSLLRKTELQRRGNAGKGALLEWKKEGGWCGWYTLLRHADGKAADVTPYNVLSFWIKGEKGGEKFDIGLADSRMQDFGVDAVYAGSVNNFLPGGITKEWQQVKVPLSRWEAWVDLSALGSMVIWFSEEGGGRMYLDDISFRSDPDIAQIEEYNAPRAERDPAHPRSLWVWKMDPVNNLRARKELLALCEKGAIDIIYQYFGDFNADEDPAYTTALAEFITECHRRNIEIEALTGNPVWSLQPNHELCLTWIRSFLEYNKTRPEEQRFDGVSLDVEPYLTGEWNQDRPAVKQQYLELLRRCRELVDGYGQDFRIGAAIPMSYELEEKADGFETQALQYLDYLALMAYYDTPKKVIDNSVFHVELAGKLGKKVWLGAEIQDLVTMKQGNRPNTFWEEGWVEMEEVLGAVARRFNDAPGFGGFAIHCDYAYKILPRGRNVPHRDRPPPEKSPAFTLASAQTRKPLAMDGRLDDWCSRSSLVLTGKTDVASGRGAWSGADDLGVRAFSMWDRDNLYLAFDVADNQVVQAKTGGDMWEGDHVECWLDVDLAGDYTEVVNSRDDFQFGFSPGNFKDLPPEVFLWTPYVEDDYRKEIQVASALTARGYTLEVRIPKQFLLKALAPKAAAEQAQTIAWTKGLRLGLSVDPSDCDDPAVPQKVLMSSSGENRIWGDPTQFGFVLLSGDCNEIKKP